jgi:hypothetical protein
MGNGPSGDLVVGRAIIRHCLSLFVQLQVVSEVSQPQRLQRKPKFGLSDDTE